MDVAQQRQKNLLEQGYNETIFKKIEKKLDWWNEDAKNKYTIGAAVRKALFMERSPHGFHSSRAGRLTERLVTLGAAAFVIASPAIVGVVPIVFCLVAAKVGGMTAGALVSGGLKGLAGTMNKLDRYFNRPKEDPDAVMDRVGIRRGLNPNNAVGVRNDGPAGARNAHENEGPGTRESVAMERPEEEIAGARQFRDTSLKESFDAAKLRTFDPKGPRPLENYGLGAKANQNKMGG